MVFCFIKTLYYLDLLVKIINCFSVYILASKKSVKQGASSSQMVDFPLVLVDFYGFRNFEVIQVVWSFQSFGYYIL